MISEMRLDASCRLLRTEHRHDHRIRNCQRDNRPSNWRSRRSPDTFLCSTADAPTTAGSCACSGGRLPLRIERLSDKGTEDDWGAFAGDSTRIRKQPGIVSALLIEPSSMNPMTRQHHMWRSVCVDRRSPSSC
jgi:hypothetical protein